MTATARLKQLLFIAAALALVGLGLVAAISTASPARAADTTNCVPSDDTLSAWANSGPSFIMHGDATPPADPDGTDESSTTNLVKYVKVGETKHVTQEAVAGTPGTPSQWWNFSPNDKKGTFTGPPDFPTDEDGTWEGPHTEGGPDQDATGTFQNGNGNASWFHREAGTEGTPGQDEVSHTDYTWQKQTRTFTEGTDCPPEGPDCEANPTAEGCPPVDTGKKIVVCKYVGTPGGTLDHIIIVDAPKDFDGTFPSPFGDAQDSIAIRFATDGEQAKDVDVAECPVEEPPAACPDDAEVNAGQTIPEGETEDSFCTAPEPGKKIVVCKYVGTPGGTLDHIIIVDAPKDFDGTFPSPFGDAQDSIAIRFATDGEQAKDVDVAECPVEEPPAACPDDAEVNAGQTIPEGETEETFCNVDPGPGCDADPTQEGCPPVCPDDADNNAGEVIPEGETAEDFCEDDDDEVCPKGTDHAGEEVKHGDDPAEVCDDDDRNPTDPGEPNGPSNHPNPGPTVKGAQATAPSASTSTPTVAGAAAARVPTAVDAGLAPSQRDLSGNGGNLGLLGIAASLVGVGLVGASLRPRRGRSLTG